MHRIFKNICFYTDKTMSYKVKQNLLPPRWLHCPRKGQPVVGIFLPFKTPLDDKFKVGDQYK